MTLQINFWTILPLLTRRHQCNPPRESRGEEAGSRSHLLRRKTDSPSQRHLPLGRGHSRCPRVWYLIGYSILGIACGAALSVRRVPARLIWRACTAGMLGICSRLTRNITWRLGHFLHPAPMRLDGLPHRLTPCPRGPQSECPTHLPHDSFVPCRPPSDTECGVSPRCPFPGLVGGETQRTFRQVASRGRLIQASHRNKSAMLTRASPAVCFSPVQLDCNSCAYLSSL
jgi:hypothetical protein